MGEAVTDDAAGAGDPVVLPTGEDRDRDAPTTLSIDAVPASFLAAVPREFARRHGILGQLIGEQAQLAITPRTDRSAAWNTAVHLDLSPRFQVHPEEDLHQVIDAAYEQAAAQAVATPTTNAGGDLVAGSATEDLETLLSAAEQDLLASDGKAPLVRFLDRLLFTAVTRGASDLHLQPTATDVRLRLRIDGVLDQGTSIPPALLRPLISRIKILGRMDVAERLMPQDGRTTLRVGERTIDVRISTIPTAYGERAVLRLLDASRQLYEIASLGMPVNVSDPFLAMARRASGIILVTGPTGSGKTTTLYATLRQLDAHERNIITIEDPIEYELSALGSPISQSQVNTRKGMNFVTGLRHILRQDPDVIMVGEIRDAETARIAIQASLTGHLVFSTLHTNDAVSAVSRLLDLGVEPSLVAASLSGVLAQRLVRTVCVVCQGRSGDDSTTCEACQGSGYRGRVGIFELLSVNEALRAAITGGASVDDLRSVARSQGMIPLSQAGAALVAGGITTATEIERVIHHG